MSTTGEDLSMDENITRRRTIVSLVIAEKTDHNKNLRQRRRHSSLPSAIWKAKAQSSKQRVMASRLLSVVYAILLILFGIIFPVSEALHENYWLESVYNGVFLVYLYSMSTVFLLYLQIYIIPASKKKIKAQQENEKRQAELAAAQTERRYSQLRINTQPELNNNSNNNQDHWMRRSISTADMGISPVNKDSIALVKENGEDQSMSWISLEHLKELFSHEGSSFYLRLGALVFGIGNMIYIGLEIDYHMINVGETCEPATFGWTYIFRLVFTVLQTFFLFKYSKIHIEVQKTLARFGFMHIIATNMCVWIRTLINEILEHSRHHDHDDDHAITTTISSASDPPPLVGGYAANAYAGEGSDNCTSDRELLTQFSPYLFPFVLEYSLIAVGIFAIMSSSLSHTEHKHLMQNLHQVIEAKDKKDAKRRQAALQEDEPCDHGVGPMQGHHHGGKITLDSSHKGMFFGIILLTGVIISMILFIYDQNHNELDNAQLNYLIADLCLSTVMLTANIMSVYSFSKLQISFTPLSVDDLLLLISMSGSVLFELSIIVSTGVYISEDKVEGDQRAFTVLAMVCSIVAVAQNVLQTLLLISGLRRYTANAEKKKHGREAVTFLIVANVTSWIFRTVQVKELELGIQEEFYGRLAWLFILNLNLPLLLFFRFHSSVCFADIWSEAYSPVDHQAVISQQPPPGLPSSPTSPLFNNNNPGFFLGDESVSIAPERRPSSTPEKRPSDTSEQSVTTSVHL